MKRHRLLFNIISLLLALCVIMTVGTAAVFAAPEDEAAQGEAVEEQQPADPQSPRENAQENAQENSPEQPEQSLQPDSPEVEIEVPRQNEWYDYIYSYEDATSAYEEPEHLGELPEVTATQVVEATAVAMPTVAVSDASLFSGIVMWLCVALGIAVIVGVLVSKRTRRRGV